MTRKMNKKGQIAQILLFFVAIIVIGLTIVLGKYILTNFTNAFTETIASNPEVDGTKALAALNTATTQYGVFDYAMVVLVVAMIIGLVVTSFMIPSHPIFIVINILGIFILVFMGMLMTNVYGNIVSGEDPTLSASADSFAMTNYIISYLPYIGAAIILVTSIVMYVRGSAG